MLLATATSSNNNCASWFQTDNVRGFEDESLGYYELPGGGQELLFPTRPKRRKVLLLPGKVREGRNWQLTEHGFDNYSHWHASELRLIMQGRKIITRAGEPHPNALVLRYNELAGDCGGLMQALHHLGLPVQPDVVDDFPLVLQEHAKTGDALEKGAMARIERNDVPRCMPLEAFWQLFAHGSAAQQEWEEIFDYFDWHELAFPGTAREGVVEAPGSSFRYHDLASALMHER